MASTFATIDTRPYGYTEEFDPTRYLHLTLDRLSPVNAKLYAGRWIAERQFNQAEGGRVLAAFSACLADNTINVLTGTPLQVTILLIITRARGTPPKQREELFDRYMDIIYQREQRKQLELLQTSQNLIYGLHKYIAYILQRRAEGDEAAAKMSVREFENVVKEYLSRDPTLSDAELETTAYQIFKEASERLVLIVGVREGTIGFELPSVREFFAAAQLVDTSRDSKERDARFRAICRSPHWRNVALFFAGRVGRRLPGEAPSLIDVCREVDTERIDLILKRGATLALQIADDRAMREPHNELGAIQYGLTRLDSGLGKTADFVKVLRGFPERYLQRVVRPELERRLERLPIEELQLCGDVYQELFGNSDVFSKCLKQATNQTNTEIKAWALRHAIRQDIREPWVVELLEIIAQNEKHRNEILIIADTAENVAIFLDSPLSPRGRYFLEEAIIYWSEMRGGPWSEYAKFPPKLVDPIVSLREEGRQNVLSLTLDALNLMLPLLCNEQPLSREGPILVEWPALLSPDTRQCLHNATQILDRWRNVPKTNQNLLESTIFALLAYWRDPGDLSAQSILKEIIENNQIVRQTAAWRLLWGVGLNRANRADFQWDILASLASKHLTSEQVSSDLKEIASLVNKSSPMFSNHPLRVYIWIQSEYDSLVEDYLEGEILGEVRAWFGRRGGTEHALSFWRSGLTISGIQSSLEFADFIIALTEKSFGSNKIHRTLWWLLYFGFDLQLIARELPLRDRLAQLATRVLDAEHPPTSLNTLSLLETLYWIGLSANLFPDSTLWDLARRLGSIADFPNHRWRRDIKDDSILKKVFDLIKHPDHEISAVAAVSLEAFPAKVGDPSTGETLWKLARDGKVWSSERYLRQMAFCQLRWNRWKTEWLQALNECKRSSLDETAWTRVVSRGGCAEVYDRNALLEILLTILEEPRRFTRELERAALTRLTKIVTEVEPVGFDEGDLNLPFPAVQRVVS